MQEILTYSISSVILSGAFYGLFRAFLQGERNFSLNRRLLIVFVFLSLALPALSLTDIFSIGGETVPVPLPQESVTRLVANGVEQTIEKPKEVKGEGTQSFSMNSQPMVPTLRRLPEPEKERDHGLFLLLSYIMISWGLCVSFYKNLQSLRNIARGGIVTKFPAYSICMVGKNIAPFSFWKTIYIPYDVYSEEETRQIILHERAHIEQRHSLDIIFFELACALAWFNPFLRLFKKSAVEIHEYLADSAALSAGVSRADYRATLYKNLTGQKLFATSHYLNKYQIKRRLKMMSKAANKKLSNFKYGLVLPAVALLGLAFSCSQVKRIEYKDAEDVHLSLVPAFAENTIGFRPPQFPGGLEALEDRLLRYKTLREIADMNDNSLEMSAEFVVDKKGRVQWPQFFGISYDELRYKGKNWDLGTSLSNILVRLPRFQPATRNGKPVNSLIRLVVNISDLNVVPHYSKEREAQPDKGAKYPGGYAALQSYIKNSLRMPVEAKKRGINEKIYVTFYVEPDGRIAEPKVASYKLSDYDWNDGEDFGCTAEALRLASGMPKWKPAVKDGKPVRSKAIIPVMFGDEYAWQIKNTDRVMIFPVIKNEESMTQKEKDKFYKENSIKTTLPEWRGNYFSNLIQKNLRYPKTSSGFNKHVNLRADFIVNSRGEITDEKIGAGFSPEFNEEALRVIKLLPPVKPALNKSGKPVEYRIFAMVDFIPKD